MDWSKTLRRLALLAACVLIDLLGERGESTSLIYDGEVDVAALYCEEPRDVL